MNVEPSLRFAPFTGEGSVRRGSSDLPGNSLSNCMERASPEIYPLLVPLFAPVAMTQASLAIEQWQVSRGISFLPSGGNFMPMVYCLVACSWLEKFSTGCTLSTGFLWLLVTDFFVHWQSGFLCSTLRHRFARSVPWHGWCLVRTSTSTAILPKRTARPTGFHAPQCTMCVGLPRKSLHILGSRLHQKPRVGGA